MKKIFLNQSKCNEYPEQLNCNLLKIELDSGVLNFYKTIARRHICLRWIDIHANMSIANTVKVPEILTPKRNTKNVCFFFAKQKFSSIRRNIFDSNFVLYHAHSNSAVTKCANWNASIRFSNFLFFILFPDRISIIISIINSSARTVALATPAVAAAEFNTRCIRIDKPITMAKWLLAAEKDRISTTQMHRQWTETVGWQFCTNRHKWNHRRIIIRSRILRTSNQWLWRRKRNSKKLFLGFHKTVAIIQLQKIRRPCAWSMNWFVQIRYVDECGQPKAQ